MASMTTSRSSTCAWAISSAERPNEQPSERPNEVRPVIRAAVLSLLLAAPAAFAGPWTVRDAAGTTWLIVQDNEGNETYEVERRLPDGKADPAFGNDGRATIRLGPDDDVPGALRVDATGRVWVAGSTQDVGEAQSSVLRFTPDGKPDPAFGKAGRSLAGPTGGELWAYDLLPLPDGSALVAGDLQGDDGDDRVTMWRLKPDGQLDSSFASRGVWQRPGTDSAHTVAMAEGPAGVFGVAAQVMQGAEPWIEVYANRPGSSAFALATRERVAPEALGGGHPLWQAGRWQVKAGRGTVQIEQAVAALNGGVAATPAATPPADTTGHAALIPFTEAPQAAAPSSPPPAEDDNPYLWAAIAGALVAGIGWLVMRRRPQNPR
jgi:uncharacterized delta-60 repeat protein